MTTRRNDLCACPKSGAWRTEIEARAALQRILAAPFDLGRGYRPTNVVMCAHRVWHLTSKAQKDWKSGKLARRRGRPREGR